MSWNLLFDPVKYERSLNEYGKELLHILLCTWLNKEEENIRIVNNVSNNVPRKQSSIEQTYIKQLTSASKNNIFFESPTRPHGDYLELQDHYNNNFEYEENFDLEIIPRIPLSPMDNAESCSFSKPLPKIKELIEMSYKNEFISKDNPPQIENDFDESIPATISKALDRQSKYLNFKCRYKRPQDRNEKIIELKTKPDCSNTKEAMPPKESIAVKTIPEILTDDVDKNRNIDNNNKNVTIRSKNHDINWDNMIDPEMFGLSSLEKPIQINSYNEKNLENVSARTDKAVVEFKNNPDLISNAYSEEIILVDDKKKPLFAVEVDKGTKRKRTKQKKISDTLNKKIKNTPTKVEKIDLTKKKTSTAIVNDWLKNNTDKFNIETNDTNKNNNLSFYYQAINVSLINKEPTLNSIDNMKQTRLVNKGGIMKFSTKDIKIQNNVIPKKSDNNKNKISKKPKFVAPFKSQLPAHPIRYEIDKLINLEAIPTFESIILSRETTVIAMTIIYREGFCQLDKKYDRESCLPEGLMICCNRSAFYYIPLINEYIKDNTLRRFVANIMLTPIRKICFEAQDLLMLFMDLFNIEQKEMSLKWMVEDPKIGCFLLNPDKPPECFSELQSQIQVFPNITVSSACVKQKTAWCLTLLVDCADKINAELEQNSLMKIFEMETKLIPMISVMELRGLNVNVEKLKEIGQKIENKMKSVIAEAYQSADRVFQINSPVQLRAILYDDLKLDQKCNIKVRETVCLGAKSTSESTLKLLAASHPLPRLILEYRHLHKALATFVYGMLQHAKNGVIRATWEQTAAATGRISSSNPNLQTIPKNPFVLTLFPTPDVQDIEAPLLLRSAYTAREGFILVAADFQHIESRIFAHLSGDEGLLEVFRQNEDFFRTLAAKWLNKVDEAVTSMERDRTKRMVYASLYGAGTKKLMEILELDYEQTLAMMASFSRAFPSLKAFSQKVVEQCSSQGGVLQSICGRRRRFPNIFSQNAALKSQAERQAVNFVIQGSAADLCKIAMIITEEHLTMRVPALTCGIQCGLVLQIHDELVWEVDEESVSLAKDVIKSAMESCGEVCGLSIPLPVSVTSGKNWADMN